MKESAKAARIKRHQRRSNKQPSLNLVSMMDIFTILVFFLMVNSSSDVQTLNQKNEVQLPVSSATEMPKDMLALTITADDILVGGRPILKLSSLQTLKGDIAPALKAELDYQAGKSAQQEFPLGRPITIVADRELPYEVLKKIMSTCVDAGYASISLAVNNAEEQGA